MVLPITSNKMTRIKLTDDDIELDISNYHTRLSIIIFGKLKDEEQAEQLKKQILEDYEFCNDIGRGNIWIRKDSKPYLELKEKAEMNQKLLNELEEYRTGVMYGKLETQVKELKEENNYILQDVTHYKIVNGELHDKIKNLESQLNGVEK